MKKYTLKAKVLDGSVTPASLRLAIEKILLQVHPPVTYRLGLITPIDSNSILAEIASDGRKEFLESRLKGLEDKLPVTIENFGWGWIADDALRTTIQQSFEQDPLAAVESKSGPVSFLLVRKVFLFRYLLMLSLPLVMVALLITRIHLDKWLVLDWVYPAVFLAWFISLNDLPLDIRLYARQIDCDPAGLVVTYWLRKKAVRMNWETISGLEYRGALCILQPGNGKPIRFLINSDRTDKAAILKTIIRRASLNNVEAGIGTAIYKRYEAA